MALTTISGKIADIKTGSFGVGLKVLEHISAGDKNFDRTWMCWLKQNSNAKVGDEVTVTGSLMVKIARDKEGGLRGYVDQTTGATVPYLDFSLNNCQVEPTSW